MKKPLPFDEYASNAAIILKIAKRASKILSEQGVMRSTMDIAMDLTACHVSTPLRLEDLLSADDFNLIHDVLGIFRHLNRNTGRIDGNFLPRFSR